MTVDWRERAAELYFCTYLQPQKRSARRRIKGMFREMKRDNPEEWGAFWGIVREKLGAALTSIPKSDKAVMDDD